MTAGGCLCGAVRFEAGAFAGGVFKCHCSKCRKAFGGASSAAVLVPADAFSWTQGEDEVREYRQSETFLRRFCPHCGGIVPQYLANFGQYWVPAGLLDSDPGLTLRTHLYVDSKAPWELLDEQAKRKPGGFDS